MKKYFAQEDALIQQRYGEASLERFRIGEFEQRVEILAVLSSLGNISLDEATTW